NSLPFRTRPESAGLAGRFRLGYQGTRARRPGRGPLRRLRRRSPLPRHSSFLPAGVIPAVLLPFDDDLAIDELSFRAHLRHVGATEGLSAITVNAHSTEVASCTFEEQRRVMDIAA